MTARILTRKLLYLHCLLTAKQENIASRLLATLASIDCDEIALVQQCHFLEGLLKMEGSEGCSLTDRVFRLSTTETEGVIRLIKTDVARADFQRLMDSVENGSSTSMLAQIREVVTWSRIWDQALDWGPKAVDDARRLFRLLCMPLFADRSCPVCTKENTKLGTNTKRIEFSPQVRRSHGIF